MIRGVAFTGVYYALSAFYVFMALPTLAFPGRSATAFVIKSYTRAVRKALHLVGGIGHEVRGREHLPDGPFIIAAKHQSWGDGFLIYPEIDNLAFVTGDHLEKFPFVSGILQKLGAIVIDTCGGGNSKAQSLTEGLVRAKADNRRILIYPEGHLAAPGHHYRYKSGVWHMQEAMQVRVVPVATNLGCYWRQEDISKRPGRAIVEFLPPIEPGLSKNDFLDQLATTIELKTSSLVAEATDTPAKPSQLLPDPQKPSAKSENREHRA